MVSLPSRVSTTVRLHYKDFNETVCEKARWDLNKDTTCCFVEILEAAPNKTAAAWPLTSHLTNQDTLGSAGESKD